MGFIFGIVNLKGGAINPENVRKLGKAVQWNDFESKIEINSSYGWGYCWNKKRTPKAGIYTSERVAVLCDARIYNSEEFKQSFEFEQPEEAFAKAYLTWGAGFADKFNGDFAAVIIDFQQQKVLLVRDHIGVRPLTYSVKEDLLIFASHEFGIAKSNLANNTLSEEALVRNFNLHKRKKYKLTVFEHIKKIIPGYVTNITTGKIVNTKYWWPEKIRTNRGLTFEMAVSCLRKSLMKSVQVRMEQGTIGAHVSGGIDSSGVAAILADNIDNKARMKGYSWSPESKDGDIDGLNEKELVDEFAEQKGIEVAYLSYKDSANIDDFILPEFEQMPIEIHTMRQACNDDISTLFSGWGGDEFVSLSLRGSINHIVFRLKLLTLFRWIKRWGLKATIGRVRGEILPSIVPFRLSEMAVYKQNGCKFFQSHFVIKHWRAFFFHTEKNIYGFGDRKGFMFRLLYRYHLPQRMDSWALFGERYGIEYKFPLLDKDLLEFWMTIPIKYTIEQMYPRLLYREALRGILVDSVRLRQGKEEAVFYKNCVDRDIRIKKMLEKSPNLYTTSSFLSFFNANEFYKCTVKEPEDMKAFIVGMYDIRFFLRYKGLVEKYVATNPYCMKKHKQNSDSENL
ncbi:asparagine synthase-related protein [Paludibacter jiangxiensis]|uniref:asparagine synthase (glutamine-hydrolyzing) n=1 Tax=Paludibacter jiangxiensis TaxID=681398 RepID=A0A161LVD3_9BACT|nr:asparagine synthase-related protein [Paludibacter jiangxiensis]GAT63209.1 glutamine amidotransferase domain-containing protein [Paludibacter jiangxiensis]